MRSFEVEAGNSRFEAIVKPSLADPEDSESTKGSKPMSKLTKAGDTKYRQLLPYRVEKEFKKRRNFQVCLQLDSQRYQKVHVQKCIDLQICSFQLKFKGLTLLVVFARNSFIVILVCSCRLFRFVKFINVDWEWLE